MRNKLLKVIVASIFMACMQAGADDDDGVIAFTLDKSIGYADEQNEITVSAKSPGGCDISGLKYCIFDAAGKELARYRNPVGKTPAKLLVNLPEGEYVLKATDGTWFYGTAKISLKKRAPDDKKDYGEKPVSGIRRAWSDYKTFDAHNLDKRQQRMSK